MRNREYNRSNLPLGVQIVIDSSYDRFKYAICEQHRVLLYNTEGDCYAEIKEENWDF